MQALALYSIRPFPDKLVRISKADHCLAPRAQAERFLGKREEEWTAVCRGVTHIFQAGLGERVSVWSSSLTH